MSLNYYEKYLKYKRKYILLKGGDKIQAITSAIERNDTKELQELLKDINDTEYNEGLKVAIRELNTDIIKFLLYTNFLCLFCSFIILMPDFLI